MAQYVRAANPIWFMVDLIGQPLNDEYYAFYLTNTLPYLPQAVFHDPEGTVPWSNPIQFYPNGTLPDDVYFDDAATYRLEIRHGNSQSDPLIYEVNNFVPGSGDTNGFNDLLGAQNQITNPQFKDINFVSPFTYTEVTPGTYTIEIGPGWNLILTGAGTVILTQLLFSGADDVIGNPPTALRINTTGWTSTVLSQRFANNGAIFSGGAIAMSVTARSITTPELVTLTYVPSDPSETKVIASDTVPISTFSILQGAIPNPSVTFPQSNNPDTGDDAFVDMQITLAGNGIIDLTNIQVLGQTQPLDANFDPDTDIPPFAQITSEQQTNQEFYYYKDSILQEAKTNLLTGWTFPMNPWQFITTVDTVVASQTQYIADQTILHQETAGALTSGKGGGGINQGLQLFAVNGVNANRFALIQYIDYRTIEPYWGQYLSSLVRSALFTDHSTTTRIKMRLIYRTAGDAIPTIGASEPITGWDSNGDVTFATGWTSVEPLNDVNYVLTDEEPITPRNMLPSYAFNKFLLPPAISTTPYLGVVIYITAPINNTLGSEDAVAFDRISLVPNDFAIDASVESYDESLRKCQYYYEKSYVQGILPGAVTDVGLQSFYADVQRVGTSQARVFQNTFHLKYKQTKCQDPTVTFYSPTGATNQIQMQCYFANTPFTGSPTNVPSSQWTARGESVDSVIMQPNDTGRVFEDTSDLDGYEAVMDFHYVADARLGL